MREGERGGLMARNFAGAEPQSDAASMFLVALIAQRLGATLDETLGMFGRVLLRFAQRPPRPVGGPFGIVRHAWRG